MLGVAVFAVVSNRRCQSAMKAFFSTYIIQDILMIMALHAKQTLLGFARGVMALFAVLLMFRVCFDHWTGH
jgi:hypothetical protein